MSESLFFQDLAVMMAVVGLVSVIFTRLGWPKVIGYLLAGILMSEHTWGELYERFHANAYNADEVWRRVEELLDDDCVTAKRGVFEYVLGGEVDTKLLNVRVFDRKTAKAVYAKQTEDARRRGVSNCPLCAVGHESNAGRIWAFDEMDADHVSAWSKGGATDASNCQMLCKTHNRAKGNR